jgi:hypothetical protein
VSRWGQPCIAITARGTVCGRGHSSEFPCTFAWDPVRGRGVGGPTIPLCRLHDYMWSLEAHERVQIVGGWMGRAWNAKASVWTVLTTVYETRDGLETSAHWWALRRSKRFGVIDDVSYHAAVAEAATNHAEAI